MPEVETPLGDVLELDDIHVEFAPDLVNMVLDPGTGLDVRIANMRRHVAKVFGVILPEIRLTDEHALPPGTYVVRIQGVEQVRARLRPDSFWRCCPTMPPACQRATMCRSRSTAPVPGGSTAQNKEDAAISGLTVVTPTEVLATHLLEIIKRNLSRLLSLKALRRLLDEMSNLSDPARAEANRRLIDELIPDRVPTELLHSVLRLLLEEQVSIRNLPLILEATAEARTMHAAPEAVCEHVRQRLGFQLVAQLRRDDGTIPLIQLAQEWEDVFAAHQVDADRGGMNVALPPDTFNRLVDSVAEEVSKAGAAGQHAAVVTSSRRRRFLRTAMFAKGVTSPVLSFEEIGIEARPALVGVVAA